MSDRARDLLQALNDKNNEALCEKLNETSISTWVNSTVPVIMLRDIIKEYRKDYTEDTCLGFAFQYTLLAFNGL